MTRERLPNRRTCDLITFESMGMKFTAAVGRYASGRIGELFLDNHKAGSAVGTLVRDAAIALSFALQHGADAEEVRRALCRDSAGRALSPVGEILDLLNDAEHAAADETGAPCGLSVWSTLSCCSRASRSS